MYKRQVLIEIKTTVNSNINLEELASTALSQIDDRMYAEEPGTMDAIRLGIAIRMKTVDVIFGNNDG